jgi:hypothetical protein
MMAIRLANAKAADKSRFGRSGAIEKAGASFDAAGSIMSA